MRHTIILLLLLFCAASVHAQDKFGYVLDIRGTWTLSTGAKLDKGSAVPVGGVISTVSIGDPGTYIVIADRSGNIFQRRNCGNAGECNNPLKLPASAGGEQSLTSRIIGAAMALVSNEPAKYASFISRSSTNLRQGTLQEGVVKLEGDRIDLSSVFKNMKEDRYLMRIEPVTKGGSTGARRKPLEFAWNPKKPQPLAAKDLAAGLYRINLLEVSLLEPDTDEHEPSGNEAWVLITRADEYTRAASSFEAATKLTKQWGTNVKPNAVREFLRASLDFITAQNQQ